MAGDKVTGVAVMRMSEGLDEGPVLDSARLRIDALDTAGTLHDRLAEAGAELMVRALAGVAAGEAVAVPQSGDGVTYARKIRRKETRLRFDLPAAQVDRQIRGLSPYPGAWFLAPSERGPVRVKALLSRVEEGRGPAGVSLDDGLLVACGDGAVRILAAQREGRSPALAKAFLRGFPIPAGARLT
jgi:methionyl-tRNA formyltransferase